MGEDDLELGVVDGDVVEHRERLGALGTDLLVRLLRAGLPEPEPRAVTLRQASEEFGQPGGTAETEEQ